MAEKTGIAWTDHTFNPWIGCTKVSAGCKFCYAERDNKRFGWVDGWGKGAMRKRTSAANWEKPIQWARKASGEGVTRRVFCASLADVFDPEVPHEWRTDLFRLIVTIKENFGNALEWLILTKRPENIADMLTVHLPCIRLGVTAEDQENADKRILLLLENWRGKNFVSYEPALGAVDFSYYLNGCPERVSARSYVTRDMALDAGYPEMEGSQISGDEWQQTAPPIQWVIAGSESGSNRKTDIDWLRSVRDQCAVARAPFFLKQAEVNGKLIKLPELDGQVWAQFPEV